MITLNAAQRPWRFMAVFPLLVAGHLSLALSWARSRRWQRWGNTVLALSAALMLAAGADEVRYMSQRALALPQLLDKAALAEALAAVPDNAALLAPSTCLAALYRRHRLLWPGQEDQAAFVITGVNPEAPFVNEDEASRVKVESAAPGTWRLRAQAGPYKLYSRIAPLSPRS